jgi:hypothetical protein
VQAQDSACLASGDCNLGLGLLEGVVEQASGPRKTGGPPRWSFAAGRFSQQPRLRVQAPTALGLALVLVLALVLALVQHTPRLDRSGALLPACLPTCTAHPCSSEVEGMRGGRL